VKYIASCLLIFWSSLSAAAAETCSWISPALLRTMRRELPVNWNIDHRESCPIVGIILCFCSAIKDAEIDSGKLMNATVATLATVLAGAAFLSCISRTRPVRESHHRRFSFASADI